MSRPSRPRSSGPALRRRGRRRACPALAAVVLLGLGGPVTARAASPRPVDLAVPELAVTVAPLPLNVAAPLLAPPAPPPPPLPALSALAAPLPRFLTAAAKPRPAVRDPGGFACTLLQLRGTPTLIDCGIHRLVERDLRGAREALEDAVVRGDGRIIAVAQFWLGEVAFGEGRHEEAERRYRAALAQGPPGDIGSQASLAVGWLALRRGDLPEAARALTQALAGGLSAPDALVVRFLDGITRLFAGRPADARAGWDAVLAAGPPPAIAEELLFWRGVAQARLGEREPALQGLERFIASASPRHPLLPDAIVQSGWVALERGAADDAVRRFLWAEREAPRPELRAQIRAGLARAYLALGDAGRARDEARRLAAESPRDPLRTMVLLLIADDAVRRDATAEALDAYRELLGLPLERELQEYATYRYAEALERQGATAEAQRQYVTLREQGQVEAIAQRAAYRLGLSALRLGRPVEARAEGEALLRAGVLADLREPVLLLAAEGAARADDPNRAVALFRLALRDQPTAPGAGVTRLVLGWALLRDGDPETALREWQQAALAADVEVAARANLAIADVALRQGRDAQALEALREFGKIAPGSPQADVVALNRGILLVRLADYAGAVQELEPLTPRLTVPSQQALLRRALGLARYQLGQYDVAERQFREAARWAPAELSSWLGAGLAALLQNRLTEADEALVRGRLAAAPEVAAPAAYALAMVARQRGDPVAFRERAVGFVDRYPAHPYASLLLYALVAAAVERGELDQADGFVKRLIKEQPKSDYVLDALVRLADGARVRPALARDTYGEMLARAKAPELRAEAWLGLADATLALGTAPEAQRAVEGFLSEAPPGDPRAPQALALLMRAHEAQGQRGRALATADSFLAQFPKHPLAPDVQLRRGYLLLVDRQWDAAQQALEAARLADEPAVAAAAQVYLGELHRSRDEHEPAIEAFLGATYLYPDTAWAARGLQGAAQSYMSLKMFRQAAILLRKLTSRPGVDPGLQQWARQALAQLGPITGEDPAQALRKGAAKP